MQHAAATNNTGLISNNEDFASSSIKNIRNSIDKKAGKYCTTIFGGMLQISEICDMHFWIEIPVLTGLKMTCFY